jgi:hypothetical protein
MVVLLSKSEHDYHATLMESSEIIGFGSMERCLLYTANMKHLILLASLASLASLALIAGCDTPEDCGNPFGCSEATAQRLTSSEIGNLIGVEEATAAVLLDDEGHVPDLDEVSDELIYALTNDDLDALVIAAD